MYNWLYIWNQHAPPTTFMLTFSAKIQVFDDAIELIDTRYELFISKYNNDNNIITWKSEENI